MAEVLDLKRPAKRPADLKPTDQAIKVLAGLDLPKGKDRAAVLKWAELLRDGAETRGELLTPAGLIATAKVNAPNEDAAAALVVSIKRLYREELTGPPAKPGPATIPVKPTPIPAKPMPGKGKPKPTPPPGKPAPGKPVPAGTKSKPAKVESQGKPTGPKVKAKIGAKAKPSTNGKAKPSGPKVKAKPAKPKTYSRHGLTIQAGDLISGKPRVTVNGVGALALARWMGAQNWTHAEAVGTFKALSAPDADLIESLTTKLSRKDRGDRIYDNLLSGAQPAKGKKSWAGAVPQLKPDMVKTLKTLRKSPT